MKNINPKPEIIQAAVLSTEQISIIRSLLYFEVFRHPLTKEEIRAFLKERVSLSSVEGSLTRLEQASFVRRYKNYYFVDLEAGDVERRINAEILFQKAIKKSARYSSIIANFPFVRCVCLSGSISKGVAYEKSDIDYFVITSVNRLWVSKLLLVLFKKTVLLNNHKNFCINYYIDDEHLELEEKNLFTATELSTVIPRYGYNVYESLINRNTWVYDYFPNFKIRTDKRIVSGVISWQKKFFELILDNQLGDLLNTWFMKKVRRKYNNSHDQPFSKEELEIMFKSKPHVSKIHHNNNQKRLFDKLEKKVARFEEIHNVRLTIGND